MNKWQGWLSMVAIAVIAVGAGLWGNHAEAGAATGLHSQAASAPHTIEQETEGWRQLFLLAEASMNDRYRVSMQWYGHVDAKQQAYLQEQLPAVLPAQTGRLTIVPAEEGAHAIIRLEGEAGQQTHMLDMRGQIAAVLAGGPAITGDWSIKLEGTWSASNGQEPSGALPELASSLMAAKVNGSYQDKGILNLTYRSELLKSVPDNKGTSLQTALHLDSNNGDWKLAIGAPMLTGEF